MTSKLQPALIAGVALGILSAIPFVNMLNACCCAWAVLGGVLASYLYIKKAPGPVGPADGAILGAIAGVVGGIIYLFLGIPLGILTGNAFGSVMTGVLTKLNPEQAAQIQAQMEAAQNRSFVEQLPAAFLGGLVGFVFLVIFAILGGLIAIPLLGKKGAGAPPPPPPPNFGGQPGGSYGNYGA